MNKTSIEWTDYTWNPVTGCDKVSQGCKFCYAEQMATRFWGERKFTDVQTHPERLNEPTDMGKKLHGKKVFVCDVSDLFHDDVPFSFIYDVFVTIKWCPNTIFQIVTKRPDRAIEFYKYAEINEPLHNVWVIVSVEDQPNADIRIPSLLQIPAVVRGLSCEPLIGPIDFHFKSNCKDYSHADFGCPGIDDSKLHWVIAGGESGNRKGVRPMHPDWVRSLRDQCKAANVPFFFKQWGAYVPLDNLKSNISVSKHKLIGYGDGFHGVKLGKSKSGNLLDGQQHLNFPL